MCFSLNYFVHIYVISVVYLYFMYCAIIPYKCLDQEIEKCDMDLCLVDRAYNPYYYYDVEFFPKLIFDT